MRLLNKTYQQIIALTLAFLMLMTSLSFAVDMHYCNGALKAVSLFGKAKSCHEKSNTNKESTCPYHQKMQKQSSGDIMDKNDCCENKTTFIQADDDRTKLNLVIPTLQQFQQFAIVYTLVFHTKSATDKQSTQAITYLSPIISRDIYVLSEAFLL